MKKILVVDDDIDTLHILKLLLSHHKYLVKTTWQWQTLVKTVRNFNPDLILLDIDLGGADGSELCKKMKHAKETKSIPVVLISVHNMPETYVKESDARGFISKPFEMSKLLEIVKINLDRRITAASG